MPREDTIARTPARRPLPFSDSLVEPLTRLRNEVDRLFDDFPARWPRFDLGSFTAAMPIPAVEMTETEKAYRLSVEVPGMDSSEIEVSVVGDRLVISGEKKEEREEKEKNYLYAERTYGAFERQIELPPGADAEKIKAAVRKGVLRITLPKTDKATNGKRRIEIDAA
jgi:HSP20 family protein